MTKQRVEGFIVVIVACVTGGLGLFFGSLPTLFAAIPAEDAPPKYRLTLLWLPQSEFAGFYVAQNQQLYEKEGVQVVLEHPQPNEDVFDLLEKGETDFVLSWPLSALDRINRGADEEIVQIAQLAQRSALMLITRKDSGIEKPQDLEGRRIGLWIARSLQIPITAWLKYVGVQQYTILPVLTSVDLFLYKGVDATVGVEYDDYYRILGSGINEDELRCFRMNEFFPEFVDDGLYCKRSLLEKDPDSCERITRATLAGWKLAFQDKEKTLKLIERICEEHGVAFNIAQQRWMLEKMEPLIFPDGWEHTGRLREESYKEMIQILDWDRPTFRLSDFAP
ncbi:MAG: ABC transporter substrate-binding protein [Thermoguttaceae bacterium]